MMIRLNRKGKIILLGLVLLGIGILAASRSGLLIPRKAEGDALSPQARQAEVLYLSPSHAPELWSVALEDSQPSRLTETGGRLFDYSVLADGERIIYSAYNEQSGIDLWEIPRQGGEPFLLLPCGTDWCYNPAAAPDGSLIAYSRRKASGLSGSQPGPPQLWLIERTTLETDVLFVDPSMSGHSPLWSPDGRYLAFVDDGYQGVRVVDMREETDFFLETGLGDGFSWAPDAQRLFIARTESTGEYVNTRIFSVDPASRQVSLWISEEDAELSVPIWSPDGAWAVVARRGFGQGSGRQLWLINPDGVQRQAISQDARANHSGYQWDPAGTRLVLQRLEFDSSSNLPEVRIWSLADGQMRTLAEDALQPRWLP
jgi:Tol biopolymer transport system component